MIYVLRGYARSNKIIKTTYVCSQNLETLAIGFSKHVLICQKESYKDHLPPSNNYSLQMIIGRLAPAVLEDWGQPSFLSCQVMLRY